MWQLQVARPETNTSFNFSTKSNPLVIFNNTYFYKDTLEKMFMPPQFNIHCKQDKPSSFSKVTGSTKYFIVDAVLLVYEMDTAKQKTESSPKICWFSVWYQIGI